MKTHNDKVEFSETAISVLEARCLRRDESGKIIETPDEMMWRVARAIAAPEDNYKSGTTEKWAERFYELMAFNYFWPNSPTLYNAGTELGQLAACFVLPVEDSMACIFDSLKAAALIHQSGGGTGYSFSRLRPKGDVVRSTGGVASGPVSFMKVFDAATYVIKQGGKRRGANMGILRCDHPDILEFIDCKQIEGEIANFNISVSVTDAFIEAYKKDQSYDLINPRTGKVTGKLRARDVMQRIAEGAWRNGEPGIINIDEINRTNPTIHRVEIEATNPCAEQPLGPYEPCNLGSINLAMFVENGDFDYPRLAETVRTSIRFLDNVIDANKYPLPEIEYWAKENRRIGLGVMGWHDALILMGIPYQSERALKKAEEVMCFFNKVAWETSVALAEEKGAFPSFKGSRYDVPGGPKVRNATRTTIAPTGTLSILASCSSGIEPIFSIGYLRKISVGTFPEIHPLFEKVAREEGFYSDELMRYIAENGNLKGAPGVPEKWHELFYTALEIPPEQHVRMQAAFQKYTDNGVSKTINLPHHATVEDVRRAFELALDLRIKGITVYRDKSRELQVLNVGTKGKKAEKEGEPMKRLPIRPRPRPLVTRGSTYAMGTDMGNVYVTINSDDKGIFEVFANIGKSGSAIASLTEAIGRLISLAFRCGVPPEEVIEQLRGIRSTSSVRQPDGLIVHSVPDAISKALEKYLGLPQEPALPLDLQGNGHSHEEQGDICPVCGFVTVWDGKCHRCHSCGWKSCE
ncbi:MAG: vitamin B12-dependent ribonucleotide reductase [bacterium JZ-2024 1]